ncbi:uncharacterized [Tachysurus ichikawai]
MVYKEILMRSASLRFVPAVPRSGALRTRTCALCQISALLFPTHPSVLFTLQSPALYIVHRIISSFHGAGEGSRRTGGGVEEKEGGMSEHVAVRSSALQLVMISGLHAEPADRHERKSGLMLHHVTSQY